jgi:mRNA-degrading endonuclease RelE of RelBE toxin-antitoxin system
MKLRFTERADKDYASLPVAIRKAFAKQLRFLLADLQHPSLHAKNTARPWMCGREGQRKDGGSISKSSGTNM